MRPLSRKLLKIRPRLMKFGRLKDSIQEVKLNVRELYRKYPKRLEEFEEKLNCFLKSDCFNSKVIHKDSLKDGWLKYETECIVPRRSGSPKVPLLLLLGNPASHSVFTGMPFAFEGKTKRIEHRFWKALKKAEILSFNTPFDASSHQKRKEELHSGHYVSSFRIGLATFYSMPSGASDKWGGVLGLYKLFGKEAMQKIGECEKDRVDSLIKGFMKSRGAVFAFQKEAFSRTGKCDETQLRNLGPNGGKNRKGELYDFCRCDHKVKLFCLPPTRNIQGEKALKLLQIFKQRALEP